MMSFMMWLMFQVASFMAMFVWYARRHPVEATQMVAKWRGYFAK